MATYLYPKKEDFFKSYSGIAPITLFLLRAKECELFARYIYERPVLDIGCGEGTFMKILFNERIDAGLDLNEKNVKYASKSGAYQKVYCGKAENIPLASSSFRTVLSNCVLEHVTDLDHALNEIYRILAPGGRAYLSVATPLFAEAMSFRDIISNKLGIKPKIGVDFIDHLFNHNYCLTQDEWAGRIKRAGLTIKETHPYLSLSLLHLMGFFLIFSLPSFIYKIIINRWRLFPQLKRPKALMNLARRYYDRKGKENGCIFFVISKE